jgi:prepilin-type N-terminal cleavage/methylation domain-containing protein
MKKVLAQGFTLVELLIVIALLGVIATIVIAAINPIEQANKARDAGYKSDASEIVSAIQRYYASQNQYPWSICSPQPCTPTYTADSPLPWTSADDPLIGLCGATTSTTTCKTNPVSQDGVLITSLELQTAFLSKTWVGATSVVDKIMVGKGDTSSASVYACWVPKANSNRTTLINSGKIVDTTTNFQVGGGDVPPTGACTKVDDPGWKTGACSECVPE